MIRQEDKLMWPAARSGVTAMRASSAQARWGLSGAFTLIELLVVIAILGILAGPVAAGIGARPAKGADGDVS